MNLRQHFKHWLYGRCPGLAGSFPYFGERIYFPRDSLMFSLACEAGIFEHDNVRIIHAAARPHTWYFDVGANIGLMSAPLLRMVPELSVLSIEPSPNTRDYLVRTVAQSANRHRWEAVPVAVGRTSGEVDFAASSSKMSVFDGLRDTHRSPVGTHTHTVPITTIDLLWESRGKPDVSIIKIDVEGGESDVLMGATRCLEATRAHLLIEWNRDNLPAYQVEPERLLSLASELGYDVYAVPHLSRVDGTTILRLKVMRGDENYLLVPRA